jgi:hypothetical protein
MPRHAHQAWRDVSLSADVQLMLTVLLRHVNVLRACTDLPPLTLDELCQEARLQLRTLSRTEEQP